MLTPFFGYDGLLSGFDTTAPYVHVRESEGAALLELEVPRFRAEEISVTPSADGTLTIVGRRGGDYHAAPFEQLMFGYSQPTAFRRVVHLSPAHYDMSKVTSAVEFGVLTVTVPKVPQQAPVKLLEGSKSRELVLKTTPQEFEAVAKAKWPPTIKREATADAVTYRCELPTSVSKDHIELVLEGRRLVLSVHYQVETATKHSTQSQAVTYSTTLGVPDGTTAQDVHTEYDAGVLTIVMARHDKPAAVPVKAASPKQ